MPGPVSDSYDPEFGTGANVEDIAQAVEAVRTVLASVLGHRPPIYILDVVQDEHDTFARSYTLVLTEQQVRVLRFCTERALESL